MYSKVLRHVPLILILISTLAESRCFSPNQIEVCNDDLTKCFCRNCLSCPPGYGLNYECSGRINQRVKLKCTQCAVGNNYSSQNSSATCQPCPYCHGHKMLHPCTTTTPTKCSPDECEQGFIWNSVVGICELDQKPTTKPIILTTSKSSTPKITPTTYTPTPTTQGRSRLNTIGSSQPNISQKNNVPLETAKDQSSDQQTKNHSSTGHINLIIGIAILVLLVALIGTGLFIKRNKIHQYFKNKFCSEEVGDAAEEESMISLDKMGGSQEPSPELPRQAKYPWPANLLLRDIPQNDLRCRIESKITHPPAPIKGWRPLGEKLELQKDTLENINNCKQEERGEQLFVALKGEKPKLTLTEFVDALGKINRIDIVELVKDYFNEKINSAMKESHHDVNQP